MWKYVYARTDAGDKWAKATTREGRGALISVCYHVKPTLFRLTADRLRGIHQVSSYNIRSFCHRQGPSTYPPYSRQAASRHITFGRRRRRWLSGHRILIRSWRHNRHRPLRHLAVVQAVRHRSNSEHGRTLVRPMYDCPGGHRRG